ncbi:AAA family ATPase [Trinickia sp.]|uniref:AAA family ATPase n=1 Tax=Trinickia sp. TaxID=2571163 RepID=UPI003F7E0076
MELTELWHFPRPDLASAYLATLNAGLVTSTTIFAPRRTGKTVFLLRDLKPLAESEGYTVVYADLWQTRQTPGAALVRAIEEALEPHSLLDKVIARLQTPVKALKGKAEFAGAKLEGHIDLEHDPKREITDTALLIDALIAELTKRRPMLFLIDEAQALGRSKEGEEMARALRTTLTKQQRKLRMLFTGSSRTKLGHVFTNANAPLYSAASTVQDFPLLGDDFVDNIARRIKESTRRKLDVAAAREAFELFGRRPEPLMEAVLALMMSPALTFQQTIAMQQEKLARRENHEGTWNSLDATERVLVRMLADDPSIKPFAKATLVRLRKHVGIEDLQATHVQKALNRLAEKTVVAKSPRDVYEFENESFVDWVRNIVD